MHGLPHGEMRLVEYDPEWPALFRAEAARIRAALGPLASAVEHVGSTSVPGVPLAKPIIDIGVAVDSEAAVAACVAPLEALGYVHRGMHGDDPARRYFVLDRGGRRLFQLHAYILPAPAWGGMLRFRDLLRSRPDLAGAYAREKVRAAEATGWEKGAYSLEKGAFVESLLRGDGPPETP